MSILEKNTIDALTFDKEVKMVILLLSDHLDWEDENEHLQMLQGKINTYFTYIQSGAAKKKYGEEIREYLIQIHFLHEPSENAVNFLNLAKQTSSGINASVVCRLS